MKLLFGLILSFLLVLPLSFAGCPDLVESENYIPEITIDGYCSPSGNQWNLFGGEYSGQVNSIVITSYGILNLSNTKVTFAPEKTTTIIVSGSLILNKTEFDAEDELELSENGNISIQLNQNSKFIAESSKMYYLSNFISNNLDILTIKDAVFNIGYLNFKVENQNNALFDNISINAESIKFNNSNNVIFNNLNLSSSNFQINNSANISFLNSNISGKLNIFNTFNFVSEESSFKENVTAFNSNLSFYRGNFVEDFVLNNSNVILHDLDVDIPRGAIYNYTLKQYWTTRYTVLNYFNRPLPDVWVTSSDRHGNQTFRRRTGSDGKTYQDTLSYFYENSPYIYLEYSNYTTNFTRERYQTKEISFNASSSKEHIVILYSEKNIIRSGHECRNPADGNIRDFCVDSNPKNKNHNSNCENMIDRDSCEVTFKVNATDNRGDPNNDLINRTFDFFTIAQSVNLYDNVSINESQIVRIKIVD